MQFIDGWNVNYNYFRIQKRLNNLTPAEAAGIELGKVISISETSSGYYVGRSESYDAAMVKEEVPVQPGELELTIQVSMVFEIAN